ncbi:unnamed protein product [Alopecurus aequalis]
MESRAIAGTPPLPYAYEPLPHSSEDAHDDRRSGGVRWRACAAVLAASALVVLVVASVLAGSRVDRVAVDVAVMPALSETARSRGKDAGVSEKTSGAVAEMGFLGAGADADGFPWSNAMLHWQRTGFHFQPEKNWMNDPNGPVYYRGWYHLFYQYNPEGAVWGNIAWGHAVSRDLIHWRHLPLAMVPDQWYDINGVWTGSATVFPDGSLNMLYTGSTNASVQVQCVAVPEDPNDSLLRNWTKHPANPVLLPPPGIGDKDFRDPTTAWFDESDQTWRTVIGSKDNNGHAGIAMVYKTKDFVNYKLIPGLLHRVEGTGMWECIDFYPVGGADNSSEELYVIKESSDDDRHDYYALGHYDAAANTWTPMDPEADLGIGLRYDWGKFYASKTFYDPAKKRRVLWGWIGETDSERADITKGWASLMSIPRTVNLDENTRSNLIQWPVQEIETLRINSTDLSGVTIDHGSVFQLPLRRATQLDIEAAFRLDNTAVAALNEADVSYNCSTSGGSANRGALGPFGLLVLADGKEEQTAVYFYVSRGLDGALQTHFCHDESRSSLAKDVVKRVVGYTVPVLDGESLSLRVLVDHSIVESFAMGGRSTATSRVYPTEAIYAAAGVYLFNNATGGAVTVERLVVHEMDSSYNQIFMAEDL